MRSLTVKLILAFFVTSVAGVALAALFIRQFVTQEFEDYVITQQSASFVGDITEYYVQNGSLVGVDVWLRQRTGNRLGEPPPPGAVPGTLPLHFALADTTGHIVIPSDDYRPGEAVSADEIARGRPMSIGGQPIGTVLDPKQGPLLTQSEERYLEGTDTALIIAAAITVAVALGLGVLVARLVTRPVRELTAATQKIAAGDLEQRVPVRSRDELGLLTMQFNSMSRDLNRATQLRRQITADIAHDLRTPLSVISGYLEALRNGDLEPTPKRFATLHDEVQSLLRLVEDLHTLSLADAGELSLDRQPVVPGRILARVAETFRHKAEQKGIRLSVETGGEGVPQICVDAERVARALSNLVSNALRYTPPGGSISLIVRGGADPRWAELIVFDTGSGIAPEDLPNVFERFYRADSARQSDSGESGLGLAIVKSVAEAHGGQIKVESTQGKGTTFTMRLPATGGPGTRN